MRRAAWFPKWVLGPLAAAAVGYLAIGPWLAGKPRAQKLVREGVGAVLPKAVPAPESTDAPPAPEVSVGVKPVPDDEPRRRRSRHRAEAP